MRRESFIFFIGLVIVLLPFLGIPNTWKRICYILIGLTVALVGYQLRRLAYVRSIEDRAGERRTDVYVEQVTLSAAQGGEDGLRAQRQGREPFEAPQESVEIPDETVRSEDLELRKTLPDIFSSEAKKSISKVYSSHEENLSDDLNSIGAMKSRR